MRSFAVLALATAAVAAPHQKRQDGGGQEAQRAAAVKEAFEFAWDGYYRYTERHSLHFVDKADPRTDMPSRVTSFCL